jgi:hypothetical protein
MTEAQTEAKTARQPAEDMSFLTGLKPRKATLGVTARGRSPQPNPCEGHYADSLAKLDEDGNGLVLCLPTLAKYATRVESYLRKAAMDHDYGITIQIKTDPKGKDTIPLSQAKQLEPDLEVFMTYQARPKHEGRGSDNGQTDNQMATEDMVN